MTERHLLLRNLHLERAAERHPIEGSPKKVGAECAVEATASETYGFITSSATEGN